MAANSLSPSFIFFLSNQEPPIPVGAALSLSLNYSFFFFCLPTFGGAYILPTAFFSSIRFAHSHFAWPWLATLLSPLCAPTNHHPHPSAYFKEYCEGKTNQPKESSSSIHSFTHRLSWHIYASTHIWPPRRRHYPIPFYSITSPFPQLPSSPSYSPIRPFNFPSFSPFGGCHPFFGPNIILPALLSPPHFPHFFTGHSNGRQMPSTDCGPTGSMMLKKIVRFLPKNSILYLIVLINWINECTFFNLYYMPIFSTLFSYLQTELKQKNQ